MHVCMKLSMFQCCSAASDAQVWFNRPWSSSTRCFSHCRTNLAGDCIVAVEACPVHSAKHGNCISLNEQFPAQCTCGHARGLRAHAHTFTPSLFRLVSQLPQVRQCLSWLRTLQDSDQSQFRASCLHHLNLSTRNQSCITIIIVIIILYNHCTSSSPSNRTYPRGPFASHVHHFCFRLWLVIITSMILMTTRLSPPTVRFSIFRGHMCETSEMSCASEH